jgi:hypothetical protein
MKGDFSYDPNDSLRDDSGVLQQQGRVLLDRDWNAQARIDARWRQQTAQDSFGHGVFAVPMTEPEAWQAVQATVDGDHVRVELRPGRGWASGLPLTLAQTTTLDAHYVSPPLAPATSTESIEAGTRDALLLEVWEDTVNAFQAPADLLEPALGGPDTTERTRSFAVARLLRLGPNDDCRAVAGLVDNFNTKGRLTVSPAPVLAVGGDCPLEAGGGYTGLEHYLYRIEVAAPDSDGARFKWSQYNGGLVGRGIFTPGLPGEGTVAVTANAAPIDTCGVSSFYLEAVVFDAATGAWRIACTANATRSADGLLALTAVQGSWPTVAPSTSFFRLWNGIAHMADHPAGSTVELQDGIRLEFEADSGSNYREGDYWAFPVRASGAAFVPPVWPVNAPPEGVVYRRVALAEITWNAEQRASFEAGEIEDCRRRFRPLSNQKVCCTFNVGDGRTSFGDFDRIEDALRHLPAAGGEICLLPGLHTTNVEIRGRRRITIRGCGTQTQLTPRESAADTPIIRIVDSSEIALLHLDLFTLGGTAVQIAGSEPGAAFDIEVAHNRMLACDNAVHARNVAALHLHHNRIRMLDKRNSGVGIFLAGDDCRIERNDLRLLPFRQMPPIDIPERPNDPIDPTDPCARIELAFANPRVFSFYVAQVWAVALPLLPVFTLGTVAPYRALGGIQLGGGCERVQVLENTVVGGAGNGITLGATAAAAPPGAVFSFEMTDPDARIVGLVSGPDGQPLSGVQITLAAQGNANSPPPQVSNNVGQVVFSVARGSFVVTEAAAGLVIADFRATRVRDGLWTLEIRLERETPVPEGDDGFLYDIVIGRNTVSAMGLSGIGVPALATPATTTTGIANNGTNATGATGATNTTNATIGANVSTLAAARALLGCPVIGLVVRANILTGNLRNPFDNALRAEAALRGLGGISLGLVDDALIADNRIEGNGRSAVDPCCGIFIQYGEDVDIHHNQVLDQGAVPNDNQLPQPGLRGGIVLGLVSSFSLMAALRGGTASTGARPAARVCDNSVVQPVGWALAVRAIGPLQMNDNALSSEFAGPSAFERLAGTVLVFNLGGVQNAGAGQDMRRVGSEAVGTAPPPPPPPAQPAAGGNGNLGMNQRARAQPVNVAVVRAPEAATLLPGGETQFNDNQSRTGPAHRGATCQLLLSFDDLAYQGNQSRSAQASPVFTNALLYGATVRALGNRLQESHPQSLLSMFTLASRANNTSMNQGDHCIIVTDTNPGMPEIQAGNQVLFPSSLCARVNMTTALLFKPLG